MAHTDMAIMAFKGWRIPRALLGSGTSAKAFINRRPTSSIPSSFTILLHCLNHQLILYSLILSLQLKDPAIRIGIEENSGQWSRINNHCLANPANSPTDWNLHPASSHKPNTLENPTVQWQDIIAMARDLAATPISAPLQQIHLHTAVHSAYLAAYHALARSNADLLVGASDTERIRPGWLRACQSLGGDYSNQRLQGDYSGHPEAIRMFADTFLALHHQRLLADEDPSATFAAAEAQAWVERASDAINAFLSADPLQRRSFALDILLRSPGAQEPAD